MLSIHILSYYHEQGLSSTALGPLRGNVPGECWSSVRKESTLRLHLDLSLDG